MSGLWIFRRFESTCASVSLQHKNKETITMENKTTTTTVLPVNRTYKSTVFTMLYADKSNLLDLYNAMAGTHYTDPELLEINTLENAIYMTIKNDVSFLIDGQLSLYEHQSTINPNIPLRFLFYISHLYSRITKDANLYGTAIVPIPAPEFVVFYNGKEQMPERKIAKLSHMFTLKNRSVKLDLEVTILNITGENNRELKAACRTLREYAIYTDKIRQYTEEMSLEEAVDRAIRECIHEDVLREFLENHRMEARAMSIFEYDQEKHMRQEREAAWKAGMEEGRRSGMEEGRRSGIEEGRRSGLEEGRRSGIEEGRLSGMEEGRTQGEKQLLTLQIRKKLAKGKDVAVIAAELEETEERIRELIEKIKER